MFITFDSPRRRRILLFFLLAAAGIREETGAHGAWIEEAKDNVASINDEPTTNKKTIKIIEGVRKMEDDTKGLVWSTVDVDQGGAVKGGTDGEEHGEDAVGVDAGGLVPELAVLKDGEEADSSGGSVTFESGSRDGLTLPSGGGTKDLGEDVKAGIRGRKVAYDQVTGEDSSDTGEGADAAGEREQQSEGDGGVELDTNEESNKPAGGLRVGRLIAQQQRVLGSESTKAGKPSKKRRPKSNKSSAPSESIKERKPSKKRRRPKNNKSKRLKKKGSETLGCDMSRFIGQWGFMTPSCLVTYMVDIECNDPTDPTKCTFREAPTDSDYCAYSTNLFQVFAPRDALRRDESDNCGIGLDAPIELTQDYEGRRKCTPGRKLSVKILSQPGNPDQLLFHFSDNGGLSFYTEPDDARVGVRVSQSRRVLSHIDTDECSSESYVRQQSGCSAGCANQISIVNPDSNMAVTVPPNSCRNGASVRLQDPWDGDDLQQWYQIGNQFFSVACNGFALAYNLHDRVVTIGDFGRRLAIGVKDDDCESGMLEAQPYVAGKLGQQFKVSNGAIGSGGYTNIESVLCSEKTIQMYSLGCDASSVLLGPKDQGGFWNPETGSFDDYSHRQWKMTPGQELVNKFCADGQWPNVSLGIEGGIGGGTNRIVMRKPREPWEFGSLEAWSYRVDPSLDKCKQSQLYLHDGTTSDGVSSQWNYDSNSGLLASQCYNLLLSAIPGAGGISLSTIVVGDLERWEMRKRPHVPATEVPITRINESQFTFDEMTWREVFSLGNNEIARMYPDIEQRRGDALIWKGTVLIEVVDGSVLGTNTDGSSNVVTGDVLVPGIPDGFCLDFDCGLMVEEECQAFELNPPSDGEETLLKTCFCCQESLTCNATADVIIQAAAAALDNVRVQAMTISGRPDYAKLLDDALEQAFPRCTPDQVDDILTSTTVNGEVLPSWMASDKENAAILVDDMVAQLTADWVHKTALEIVAEVPDIVDEVHHRKFNNDKLIGENMTAEEIFQAIGSTSMRDGLPNLNYTNGTSVDIACQKRGLSSEELKFFVEKFVPQDKDIISGAEEFEQETLIADLNLYQSHVVEDDGATPDEEYVYRPPNMEGVPRYQYIANQTGISQPDRRLTGVLGETNPSQSLRRLLSSVETLRAFLPQHSESLLRRLNEECQGTDLDCLGKGLKRYQEPIVNTTKFVIEGLEELAAFLESTAESFLSLEPFMENLKRIDTGLFLAAKIPKIGAVVKPFQKGFKILYKPFNLAFGKIGGIILRNSETWVNGTETALDLLGIVPGAMSAMSSAVSTMRSLQNSTCVRATTESLVGFDIFAKVGEFGPNIIAALKNTLKALRGLEKALLGETWRIIREGVEILSDIASSWALGAIQTTLNMLLQMRVQIRWPAMPQPQTCYEEKPFCASKGYAVHLDSGGMCTEKTPEGYGIAWYEEIGGAIGVTDKVFRRTCSDGGLHHGEWLGAEGHCYNNYHQRDSRYLVSWYPCGWFGLQWCHQSCSILGSGWRRKDPLYCIRDCPPYTVAKGSLWEMATLCYNRECPEGFSVVSEGKYCYAEPREIRSYSATCLRGEPYIPVVKFLGGQERCCEPCGRGLQSWVPLTGLEMCLPDVLDALFGMKLVDLADALTETLEWIKDTLLGKLLDAIEIAMDWIMENIGVIDLVKGWIKKIPAGAAVLLLLDVIDGISVDFFPFDLFNFDFPDPREVLDDLMNLPQTLQAEFLGSLPEWLSGCVQAGPPIDVDFQCIASQVPVLGTVIDGVATLSSLADSAQSGVLEIASELMSLVSCSQETEIVVPVRAALNESLNIDIGTDECDIVETVCTDVNIGLDGIALNNMLQDLWVELEPLVNQLIPAVSEGRKLSDSDDTSPTIIPLLNLEWDLDLPESLKFSKSINLPAKIEDHALITPSQLVIELSPVLAKIILEYDISKFGTSNFLEGIGVALEIRPFNIAMKHRGGETIYKVEVPTDGTPRPISPSNAAILNKKKVEELLSELLEWGDSLGWNLHFEPGRDDMSGRIVPRYKGTPIPRSGTFELDRMRGIYEDGRSCYKIESVTDDLDENYSVTRPPRKYNSNDPDIQGRKCAEMVKKISEYWKSHAQTCWCSIYLAEDILFPDDPKPILPKAWAKEWKNFENKVQMEEYGRLSEWTCTRKNMQRVLSDNRANGNAGKSYTYGILASLCHNYWVVEDEQSAEQRNSNQWISPNEITRLLNENVAVTMPVDVLKTVTTKRHELVKHHLHNFVAFHNFHRAKKVIKEVLVRGSDLGWSYPPRQRGQGKSLWDLSNCFLRFTDCNSAKTDVAKSACHLSRLNYNMNNMDDVLGYYTHGTGVGVHRGEGKDGDTFYVKSSDSQGPVPVAENYEQFSDTPPQPEQKCSLEIVKARNLLFSSPPNVPIECEPKTLRDIFEFSKLTKISIYSDLFLSPDNEKAHSPYEYLLLVSKKIIASECLDLWKNRLDEVDVLLKDIYNKQILTTIIWGANSGWQYPAPNLRNSDASGSLWLAGLGCYDVQNGFVSGIKEKPPPDGWELEFNTKYFDSDYVSKYPDRISDDEWRECEESRSCRFQRALDSGFDVLSFARSCRENVYVAQDLLFRRDDQRAQDCFPATHYREYLRLNQNRRDRSNPPVVPNGWITSRCSEFWTDGIENEIATKLQSHIGVVSRMCTGWNIVTLDGFELINNQCFTKAIPTVGGWGIVNTLSYYGHYRERLGSRNTVKALISAGGKLISPDAVKTHTLPLFGLLYRELGLQGCPPPENGWFSGGYLASVSLWTPGLARKWGLAPTFEFVNQALVAQALSGEPSDRSSITSCWTSFHIGELMLWESDKRKLSRSPTVTPLLGMQLFKTKIQLIGGNQTPENPNPSSSTSSTSVATPSTSTTTSTSVAKPPTKSTTSTSVATPPATSITTTLTTTGSTTTTTTTSTSVATTPTTSTTTTSTTISAPVDITVAIVNVQGQLAIGVKNDDCQSSEWMLEAQLYVEGHPGQQFKVSADPLSGGYFTIESVLCSERVLLVNALDCFPGGGYTLVLGDATGGFWNPDTGSFDDYSNSEWKMTEDMGLVNKYCTNGGYPNTLGIDGENRLVMQEASLFNTNAKWTYYRVQP